MATSVYDSQAALAGTTRLGQKKRHFSMRLMAIHAVQVDMILNTPAAAPQVAQQRSRQSLTQERIGATEIEPVVRTEWSME